MPAPEVSQVGSIRVLAAQLSDDLFQVLEETVERHADLQLIGRVSDQLTLLLSAAEGVDLVVSEAARGTRPGLIGHLLGEYPEIKVLVYHPGGGVTIYWRGLRRRQLDAKAAQPLYVQLRAAHTIETTQ